MSNGSKPPGWKEGDEKDTGHEQHEQEKKHEQPAPEETEGKKDK